MPVSEFSQSMAEMIARARPPQAPVGGGPTVLRGGGEMGSLGGKSTQVSAAVDLGPWMRLFGYKTPKEKEEAVAGLAASLEQRTPEDRDQLLKDSRSQMAIEVMEKTNYPIAKYGFTRSKERTPLGKPVYSYVPVSPEAQIRAGKPTKEQVFTGAYGETARGKALKARKEVTEAAKPFEVEKFMATAPSAEITKYTENKAQEYRAKALAEETPLKKQLYKDQSDMHQAAAEASRMSTKFDEAKLKYLPEEQVRATQESKAKIISLDAEAKRNNAHADYFLSEAKRSKEEAKESNILMKGTIDAYRTARGAWINAYAKGGGEERTSLMGVLTGITESYITSTDTLKRPELGNDALSFWLASANDELSVALEPGTGKLPTVGKGPLGIGGLVGAKEVQPRKDMLFQQRASQIVSFMQSMGSTIDDKTAYKSLDLFTRIYGQTTHTSTMNNYAALMVEVGKALGYPMTTLKSLIEGPKTSPSGVTETPLAPLETGPHQ